MADTHFNPQPRTQFSSPSADDMSHTAKRRKIIGQCPTCHQTFASRSELRQHMADPQTHPPADESDAVSFGEMSDYDSLDDDIREKPFTSSNEPTLENDGFEFNGSTFETDGFEFRDSSDQNGPGFFEEDPSMYPHFNAEQGSVHTIHDEDEQPSTENTSPEQSRQTQVPRKQALGILYCDVCEKYFGNEKVFKQHFMFGVKHGEEPRRMRDLYYKVWGKTWAEEARNSRRASESTHAMEF